MEEITAEWVRRNLPVRRADGHKGTFGRVYICGGCTGYTGAPVYAGEAAMRAGSGLVFVGVPQEIYPIVAARCAAAMAQPLPERYAELLDRASACNAVLIGPGLGRAERTEQTVVSLLADLTNPVVLDADGINAVSTHIDVLTGRRGETVVTPHAEEFRRLGGDLSQGRERAAADFARRHGCVLVLKGPGTLVAAPDGRLLRNPTGNSGMAKGGSGDVLAGMILSLLGQGRTFSPPLPAPFGSMAGQGDLCAAALTEYAMTPPDLIERLPAVFKELEK